MECRFYYKEMLVLLYVNNQLRKN